MCATAMAVRGVICANPVHTRIIADRTSPKIIEFPILWRPLFTILVQK
jgi:hypothetical protein